MRLLIVGDSHCRKMKSAIKFHHSHIETMLVFKPRAIEEIADLILNVKRNAAIYFNPYQAIIHCGHNNIVPHPIHNLNPLFSQVVIDLQIQLAQDIQAFLPNCSMSCSAIYPRTYTASSKLNPTEVTDYNKLAKRYGQRLRASCLANKLCFSLNNIMWRKISKSEEESGFFLPDGLHLNPDGVRATGKEWIASLIN